jgi:hypothetical protein
VAKLIETKIAEMLDGGEPLAWAIRKDGRMKVIAHDGREYWFEASEVAAARAAIERGEGASEASTQASNPGTAPLPDPEPGTAPGNKPKPATAARDKLASKSRPATAASKNPKSAYKGSGRDRGLKKESSKK